MNACIQTFNTACTGTRIQHKKRISHLVLLYVCIHGYGVYRIMIPAQEAHAKKILEASQNLRSLRFELCPKSLPDEVNDQHGSFLFVVCVCVCVCAVTPQGRRECRAPTYTHTHTSHAHTHMSLVPKCLTCEVQNLLYFIHK
jgi:hypothetical protein